MRPQLPGNRLIQIKGRRVVTPENLPGKFRPVKCAGLESFQVQIECCCHGSSVESGISRHPGKSKRRQRRGGHSALCAVALAKAHARRLTLA